MFALTVTLFSFSLSYFLILHGVYGLLVEGEKGKHYQWFVLAISLSIVTLSVAMTTMYQHREGLASLGLWYFIGGLGLFITLVIAHLIFTEPRHKAVVKTMIQTKTFHTKGENRRRGTSEHLGFIKSLVFIYGFGVVANTVYFYMNTINPFISFAVSLILIILGIILYLITLLAMSEEVEVMLITAVVIVSIIVFLLVFLKRSGSDVLWPVVLIFLLIPILYNNFKMYAWIANVSTVVLLLSWWLLPSTNVQHSLLNGVAKIIVYLLCIVLASYINRNYIAKLQRVKGQIRLNKVLYKVSAELIKVTEETLEPGLESVIVEIAQCIGADQAYIMDVKNEGRDLVYRTQWAKEKGSSGSHSILDIDFKKFGWFGQMLRKGTMVSVDGVNALPATAVAEKIFMEDRSINALLCMPIIVAGKVEGFVGFNQRHKSSKKLTLDNQLLKVVPNIIADAFKKVEVEKGLKKAAYYDRLTGLPNRASLEKALDQAMYEYDQDGSGFAIVFIDLDGFKTINDTLGHNWGDELLRQISERLLPMLETKQVLARFGGDEFIMILQGVEEKETVEEKVKRIIERFKSPFVLDDFDQYITISAGIVIYPECFGDRTKLIQYADIALYEAKRKGKNRYIFYADDINQDGLKNMAMTNSLYEALERDELYLMYQPQVNLTTGCVIGYEALVRWKHPVYGNVPPSVFIPIAEETGLIHKIGQWILNEACQQNKRWQEQGHSPSIMAVNFSVVQFKDPNFIDLIISALKKSGLEGKYLEAEITEGTATQGSLGIVRHLNRLKALGVSISIDDFGTEYSSLKRLRALPIDRLKIDIQFIKGIGVDDKDEAMIKSFVYLSKSLGMKIIAEGVETEAQRDFLVEANCDEVQGYFYYKPLLPVDIERNILKQATNDKLVSL